MTPKDLIAAFDEVAEAPDGVTRLRELVLQLAVRGRLVPQNPGDEPASVLLERIAEEKARLVRDGKIRKPKPPPPVPEKDVPFDVPKGWMPARFLDVALWALGSGFPKRVQGHQGMPFMFCKVSDMNRPGNERFIESTANTIDATIRDEIRATINPAGTIVFPKIGGAIATNKRRILVAPTAIDNNCLGLTPIEPVDGDWLYMLLSSIDLALYQSGTSMPALSQKILQEILFGLPPTAEQHRIVAKVDELMGLLDRLEAARRARETTRTALRDAALAALRDADTPEEVEAAWARIAERTDDLFTDPADIDPLRQTVLHLAVRGRLVPQGPKDEAASVLLEHIAVEKARMVKEGEIRKPKPLPPISEDEMPFEVPEGWSWTRAESLFQFITSGSRGWAKFYSDDGPIFLRIGNLDYGTTALDLINLQRVAPPEGAEGLRTAVEPGDILVSITGDTGMVGLAPQDLGPAYINQHIALCRPATAVFPDYLARVFTSLLVRDQLWGYQRGVKNSLGLGDIRILAVPLPPLAEQHRIVAKVDELMALLDRLGQRLADKTITHDAFAAAAIHHLDA